jgi:hypothetical protein
MRSVSDRIVEKTKTRILCSTIFFKSSRLWDNVEKYGTARRATDDNIIRHMRKACWITKTRIQTHTLIFYTYRFVSDYSVLSSKDSRESSDSIVTMLGWRVRGSNPGKYKRIFSMNVHNGSGACPVSYLLGTGILSPRVKRPGREVNHTPPSSAEVKNKWSQASARLSSFLYHASMTIKKLYYPTDAQIYNS